LRKLALSIGSEAVLNALASPPKTSRSIFEPLTLFFLIAWPRVLNFLELYYQPFSVKFYANFLNQPWKTPLDLV
jgi:hypothetical protein